MLRIKIWKPIHLLDDDEIVDVSRELGTGDVYTRLLINRGINTLTAAKSFFQPDLNDLHDPFLFMDMEAAVNAITTARDQNKKVWVYGDYDVDGTTSVALMFGFLRQFIGDIDFYIPDREKEGYGISKQAIELAISGGVDLIIALDCGVRAVKEVEMAKAAGIDFIICDHHEPGEVLPDAIAILDAKRDDDPYPFDELSGCGVGFKLMQALCMRWDIPIEEAYSYLDLVAVSIASDLVPMSGENRILTWHGLKKLNDKPSRGLKTIIEKFIAKPDLDVTVVVFMIGPRINAAGRMSDAKTAVKLLLADEDIEAWRLSEQLNEFNQERKGLDAQITSEALGMLRNDPNLAKRRTNVVWAENWHKGVIGIVASRILEQHYKPTIVLTRSGDNYVGSARSIASFNIHDALMKCENHLIQFGGHKYAAGMKIAEKDLSDFREAFEETAIDLTEEDLTEVLKYEAEITLDFISDKSLINLRKFAPFGPGNPEPVFLFRNVVDTGNAVTMGSGYAHLRMNLIDDSVKMPIGAVAFGLGKWYEFIKRRIPFDVLATIDENHFNNRSSLQLMVKDIRMRD